MVTYQGHNMVGKRPGVIADQLKALVDTIEVTNLFVLPGFKLSTLGSASRETVLLHYPKLD